MDREAWRAVIHGVTRVRHDWATELNWMKHFRYRVKMYINIYSMILVTIVAITSITIQYNYGIIFPIHFARLSCSVHGFLLHGSMQWSRSLISYSHINVCGSSVTYSELPNMSDLQSPSFFHLFIVLVLNYAISVTIRLALLRKIYISWQRYSEISNNSSFVPLVKV